MLKSRKKSNAVKKPYVSKLSPDEKLSVFGKYVVYEHDPSTGKNVFLHKCDGLEGIEEWAARNGYSFETGKVPDKERIKFEHIK